MKFKGVIIWLVCFIVACVAMHHICASVRVQLDLARAHHQHQLEEADNVR